MTHYEQSGDNSLMALIAQGDKKAFTELMRRYLPVVLNFNKQYLPQEAEDICQEAFIRLWNKAPDWRDHGISPKAWLLRVSYNLCIDELRKHKTETLDNLDAQLADSSHAGERLLAAQTDLDQQLQALQALPERQRSAILLCAISDLSNKDAAAVLNISVDALESLLSRGRRALKKAFTERTGYEFGDYHDYA